MARRDSVSRDQHIAELIPERWGPPAGGGGGEAPGEGRGEISARHLPLSPMAASVPPARDPKALEGPAKSVSASLSPSASAEACVCACVRACSPLRSASESSRPAHKQQRGHTGRPQSMGASRPAASFACPLCVALHEAPSPSLPGGGGGCALLWGYGRARQRERE